MIDGLKCAGARNESAATCSKWRGAGETATSARAWARRISCAVLYFHEMRIDPARLDWPDRDRFVLSTGHYSIVLFAALTELGVFPEAELRTYGADESRFEMSTCITTPGVEITGGSLGHGLSQAVGMALGSRLSGRNFRVFNFLSDGEIQEGATWEAAMAAGHYRLENLIAIVDVNNMQADGPPPDVMTIEPLVDKWRAFGWHAQRVNGNSIEELVQAFDTGARRPGQPKVLVCYTRWGKACRSSSSAPKPTLSASSPRSGSMRCASSRRPE